VYLTLAFVGALVLVGTFGEISGFRAIVCAKDADDFARRAVFLSGIYVIVSLLLSFLAIRLLHL
jgi:hypothetical protein